MLKMLCVCWSNGTPAAPVVCPCPPCLAASSDFERLLHLAGKQEKATGIPTVFSVFCLGSSFIKPLVAFSRTTRAAMALVPEADDDERSDGDVDEIDLLAYEQDPWDDAADFLHQQRARLGGAAGGVGFLVAGKPGAGKAHLAEKLAAELGAVHVGLPQILSLCVQAYSLQVRHDALSKELADEQAKAPIASTAEGAYNDEEGGGGSGDGGDGPDPEKVSALQGDAAAVLAEWAQLPLPPREFKAAGEFAEAAAALMAGKAVEGDLLSRLLVARLRCPDVMFRGYVLESLPPPLLPDMLLQDGLPKLEYVLVIELTDEECKARLESLQLEPVANRLFSLGDRTPGDHQPLVEEVDAEGNPVTDADGAPVMVRPPLLSSRARPPSTMATPGPWFPTDRVRMMMTGA